MEKENKENKVKKPKEDKKRVRIWTCIQYEDSAPDNWREKLDDLHIPWLESPLHDKDKNPDGTVKKVHRHILLKFGSKKSYRQVDTIVKDCLKGPNPQPVNDMRGMVRYFVHLDNPEKYQYSVDDLVEHCGIDIGWCFESSRKQRYELIREMIEYVRDNDITEISDLMEYAMTERFQDWFPLLADNSLKIVESYVNSKRYHVQQEKQQKAKDDMYIHDMEVKQRALRDEKMKLKKETERLEQAQKNYNEFLEKNRK